MEKIAPGIVENLSLPADQRVMGDLKKSTKYSRLRNIYRGFGIF